MFLMGSPFQVCYSLPRDVAQVLSRDLQAAAEQAHMDDDVPRN